VPALKLVEGNLVDVPTTTRTKVLLADDQPSALRVLTETLESSSFEVVAVTTGDAALAVLLGPNPPQIAVLDWTMPGCDGPAVCRRIRAARRDTPFYFILVTAHGDAESMVSGLSAGADDFIAKPCRPDVLLARLRVGERTVRAHEESTRTSSYLKTILSYVDSGMMLSDPSGKVVFANDRLAHLIGTQTPPQKGSERSTVCTLLGARATDPRAAVGALISAGDATHAGKHHDLELSRPTRAVVRWTSRPVPLPDGQGRLDVFRDATAEVDAAEKREKMAMTDAVTGLPNRALGVQLITRELSRAKREATPLGVVMVDIDHFKKVNDTHGHAVGDRVLHAVAQEVAATIRGSDACIRWGGEEMLLLLPRATFDSAMLLAERVRARIEALHVDGLPTVTLSLGAAELVPGETSLDPAIARADALLYAAKSTGRNRVGRK
jgi:two-component system cell cycle response regulator